MRRGLQVRRRQGPTTTDSRAAHPSAPILDELAIDQPHSLVEKIDRLQRRRAVVGFPVAVFKRYYEDHCGWLGSLISYYGFFALYPLLVVFTTIATRVFNDR